MYVAGADKSTTTRVTALSGSPMRMPSTVAPIAAPVDINAPMVTKPKMVVRARRRARPEHGRTIKSRLTTRARRCADNSGHMPLYSLFVPM